jgi:RimJ/RimL family protein N-acetyltransferase
VPYWRKGYTSEALALMCYFCFKHLGAAVITSSAFVGNLASRRVQEKNGFQFEGTLRRQIFKDGKWIDLWHLSLLAEEWEKRGFKPIFEKLVPVQEDIK